MGREHIKWCKLIGIRQKCPGRSVGWVTLDHGFQNRDHLPDVPCSVKCAGTQIVLIGASVVRPVGDEMLTLIEAKRNLQCTCNGLGDVFLDCEYVFEFAVIA